MQAAEAKPLQFLAKMKAAQANDCFLLPLVAFSCFLFVFLLLLIDFGCCWLLLKLSVTARNMRVTKTRNTARNLQCRDYTGFDTIRIQT